MHSPFLKTEVDVLLSRPMPYGLTHDYYHFGMQLNLRDQ